MEQTTSDSTPASTPEERLSSRRRRRLLQRLRALLARRNRRPRARRVHRCGVALRAVRRTGAYRLEGFPSFADFCDTGLRREFKTFGYSSARRYLRVAHGFTAEDLEDCDAPIAALALILAAPKAHHPRLLILAEHLRLPALRALVQALRQSPSAAEDLLRAAETACGLLADRRAAPRAEPPPSPPAAAPPRPRLRPGRACLPVPVPLLANEGDPTPFEAQAALVLVLLHEAERLADLLYYTPPEQRWPLHASLELCANRVIYHYKELADPLMEVFAPLAQQAAAALRDSSLGPGGGPAPHPDDDAALDAEAAAFDEALPLPRILLCTPDLEDRAVPLLGHAHFEEDDPSDEPIPEPRPYDRQLFRLLGVLRALRPALTRLCELRAAGHTAETAFYYQLHRALRAPRGALMGLLGRGHDATVVARARLQEQEALRAARRAALEQNLVVLGESFIPDQYAIIGRTRDGRYVAISLHTPQVIVLVGSQGWGKSHLAVLLAEACVLRPPGLCRMPAPPRVIWISADWQHGAGNHQALCGYYQNPYPDQRRVLAEEYMVQPRRYAYEGGTLLCLPGSRERLAYIHADLVDRGLHIVEGRLHESEFGHLGLEQFLRIGACGSSKAEQYLESLLAAEGPDLTLRRLRARVSAARIDRRAKEATLQQLDYLATLTSEDEHLIDHLEHDQGPLCVLLDSQHLGRAGTLALETTMMNALSRPLRSGADPMRMFFIDELSKRDAQGKRGAFYKEGAGESRHRPNSHLYAGQLISDLPAPLLSLAMISGLFRMGSEDEIKKARRRLPGLAAVRPAHIRALPRGVVCLAAVRASDPLFTTVAQEVILRPALVHAGGETLTAI